jgi:HEAT repeat protein
MIEEDAMYRFRYFAICTLCMIAVSIMLPCTTHSQSQPAQTAQTRQYAKPASKPDDAHLKAADALLQQVWRAEPGQPKFDAIDAVVKAYRSSDVATRDAIAWLCVLYMKDANYAPLDRWPLCYVLSRSGHEQAVPDLIDVLLYDKLEVMRAVAAEALGGLYKDTANATIRDALLQALRTDTSQRVRDTISKYVNQGVVVPVPDPPDDARRKAADALLQQIWSAQPGQPKFDAIDAVVKAYKASDAPTQHAIAWLCLTYMKDTTRGVLDRWPCCYVLTRGGYTKAVPDLIEVLLHNEVEAMRAVAAEALGGLYKDTASSAIRDALTQAARTDTSQWVRDTIARYIPKDTPATARCDRADAATTATRVRFAGPSGLWNSEGEHHAGVECACGVEQLLEGAHFVYGLFAVHHPQERYLELADPVLGGNRAAHLDDLGSPG